MISAFLIRKLLFRIWSAFVNYFNVSWIACRSPRRIWKGIKKRIPKFCGILMETLGRWGTFLLKSFLDSSSVSIMICCISNSFYFRSNVWKDGRALCSALIIKPWLHSWEREKIKAFLGGRLGWALFSKNYLTVPSFSENLKSAQN